MEPEERDTLAIGDAVRIHEGGRTPGRAGRVADKIHDHAGVYTVLVEIGRAGKKPFLKYFDLSRIRRA